MMSQLTFASMGRESERREPITPDTGPDETVNAPGAQLGVRQTDFCIRAPTESVIVPCGLCGRLLKASGPTGYLQCRTVCDACLLAGDQGLGMAMLMLSVCRSYGESRPETPAEEEAHRRELLAFARVYSRCSLSFGKARPWSGFLADLDSLCRDASDPQADGHNRGP